MPWSETNQGQDAGGGRWRGLAVWFGRVITDEAAMDQTFEATRQAVEVCADHFTKCMWAEGTRREYEGQGEAHRRPASERDTCF